MTFMEHTPGRVLVIEDEPQLLEATVTYLNMEGFVADGVAGLNAATQWMRTHLFDILILDLGLSDGDGLDWLQRSSALQGKGVIITTARGEASQRIDGVKAGADVYLVKPVQLEELASLVSNLLRRISGSVNPSWTLNRTDWTLRSSSGMAVRLTHSESVLMQKMADKPGAVVPRQDLAISLGHHPEAYDFRRMEILVRRLRQKVKLGLGTELPLETVRKTGYAFTASIQVR